MTSFIEGISSEVNYTIKLKGNCFIDNLFLIDYSWKFLEPIPPIEIKINNENLPNNFNTNEFNIQIKYNGETINTNIIKNSLIIQFNHTDSIFETKSIDIIIKKNIKSFNLISPILYEICNQNQIKLIIERYDCYDPIYLNILESNITIINWTTSTISNEFYIQFNPLEVNNNTINIILNGCNTELNFSVNLVKIQSDNIPILLSNIPITSNTFNIYFDNNGWQINEILYNNDIFQLNYNNNLINGNLINNFYGNTTIETKWINNCSNELININIPFDYNCKRDLIICDISTKINLSGTKITSIPIQIKKEDILCCNNEDESINYEIINNENIKIWTPLIGSFVDVLNVILEINDNTELPIKLTTCSGKLEKELILSFNTINNQTCPNPIILNISTTDNTLIINLEALNVQNYLFTYAPQKTGYPINKINIENNELNSNSIIIDNIEEGNYLGTLQSICDNNSSDIIKFNFNIINNFNCFGVQNFQVVNINYNFITLEWESDDSKWEIQWGKENDTSIYTLITDIKFATLYALESNQNYIIQIRSICGNDFSEIIQIQSKTNPLPCQKVMDLKWEKINQYLNLSWTSNGNKWKVVWFSNHQPIKEVFSLTPYISISDLNLDTLWTFRIYNFCDNISLSEYEEITWIEYSITCNSPTNLIINLLTKSEISLTWDGDGDAYNYELKLDNGNIIKTYNTNTNQIFIDDLISNTNYYGELKSLCDNNTKSESIIINFKTLS